MPLQLALPIDNHSIEIDEFDGMMEHHKFDLTDHEHVIALAPYFNQLNNNKRLMLSRLCEQLKDFKSFQKNNIHGPEAFILYKGPNYMIRAVIWSPMKVAPGEEGNLDYEVCHDHNFDLLSAGYYGPGYKTRCYTYNFPEVKGLIGEKVEMSLDGTFTLAEGDLLFYRAKQDIHIQLLPESISVSLNLIFNHRPLLPQYQFSEKTRTISRYLHSSNAEFAIRLAGALGHENFVEPLLGIFERSETAHLSALAATAITQIRPKLSRQIEEKVLQANDPLLLDLYQRETAFNRPLPDLERSAE